jgi:hypothetical protein
MSQAERHTLSAGTRPAGAFWDARRPALSVALAPQTVVVVGLFLTLLLLAVVCARYLAVDAYIDHIEGNIVIRGWEYIHGAPLYELQDGSPHFANLYGPLTCLVQLPALLALGATVIASKATAIAALLATIAIVAAFFFRGPPVPALHGLFFLVAGLAMMSPTSFWTRADPFETLLVAVGVVLAASPVAVGICIGLAVNFKALAFLFFLPIVLELARNGGWRALLLLVSGAGAAFLAPFLLPGVSLHDYLVTLFQQAGGQHHVLERPWLLLGCLTALALPVALSLGRRRIAAAPRIYGWASLASLVLLLYPATFPGAGPYHFLPLLPVLAEARRRLPVGGIGAQFAVFPILLIAASTTHYCLRQAVDRDGWGALANEAVSLARSSPAQPAEIGYGDTRVGYEIAQLAKAKLALDGTAPMIDAQILMELRLIGIDGSRRWVPYLSTCRIAREILPRNQLPFATRGYFYDNGPVFDAAFRAAFAAHYVPVERSAHFAAWECRR